jgi:O-antigen/teichoic acid export membrane protein
MLLIDNIKNNRHQILLLWNRFHRDSLLRNSVYIMLATFVMSVLGFIFWIICSRLYTPHEVGLATSLISITSLLSTFSLFGLNNVIIRFAPHSKNKNELIITTFFIVLAGSLLISSGFLVWAYATNNPVIQLGSFKLIVPIFILFVLLQATGILLEGVFIAHRDTKYILFKNTIFSLVKLLFPFLLASLGAIGIIYSITGATLIAWFAAIGALYFITNIRLVVPRISAVNGLFRFSSGNYFGNIFSLLPASLLPIIITSRLGAQQSAYFYMPLMMTALINVIPSANAQSLFAEASHNETDLLIHLKKALLHLFLLLTPTVLIIELFGHIILGFFGTQYQETGTAVLRILAIASFIGSLNYFGNTLLNIKKLPLLFTVMNAFNAFIIVTAAYLAAPFGLKTIALAALLGQVLTLLLYVIINKNLISELFLPKKSPSVPL